MLLLSTSQHRLDFSFVEVAKEKDLGGGSEVLGRGDGDEGELILLKRTLRAGALQKADSSSRQPTAS